MIDGDAELLAYYLATADARVERLQEAIAIAREDRGDKSRDGLRQVVHRVAGSAGTYGFAELTKTARALESRLAAGKHLDDAAMSSAVSLLDDMQRAFAAARLKVQQAASEVESEPESETASELEISAASDDEAAQQPRALAPEAPVARVAVPAMQPPARVPAVQPPARAPAMQPAARPPASANRGPVIVTPAPPSLLALPSDALDPQEAPVVALFVGKGTEASALSAARSVASALAQAGVRLVCCGEGPCLSSAAQGFAESGGTTFRLEGREERAFAGADGVLLLRGTSFEPTAAHGKPMVRANTTPQDAVIELLELLAQAESAAAA